MFDALFYVAFDNLRYVRTASDLEESGVIDKYQKGVIKDLIISGDIAVQQSLDKCEKGDTSSLEGGYFYAYSILFYNELCRVNQKGSIGSKAINRFARRFGF